MLIVQIDLENFKSYEQTSVRFIPGTNAIFGRNGAGKSTLLEAIGFAVFGHTPYTQSQFVREGKNTGTVTVHIQGDDDRIYQVVRKCGSYSQHYVYDPELDEKIVEGVGDSITWLREFLGVGDTADLAAIFRDAVGVPQGLLTAVFLEPASKRKDTFNPLLRVDEYEEIWVGLLESKRWLEHQIQEKKEHIAGLEAEAKRLPEIQERAKELAEKIDADEQKLRNTQDALGEVIERKDELEKIKSRIEELDNLVAEAETRVKTLEAKREETQKGVERAEQAQAIVMETKPDHEAYKAARRSLEDLEHQRKERDRLKEEHGEHDKALTLARNELERLEEELEKIAAAEDEIKQLKPRVERQETLEEDLEKGKRAADRLEETKRRLGLAQTEFELIKSNLERVKEGLEKRSALEDKIVALKAELESLDEERQVFVSNSAAQKAHLDQLQGQTQALEDTRTAQCPVCEKPLTPEHREELLTRNQAQMEKLKTNIDELENKQEEIERERKQKQDDLQGLEKKTKEYPRQAELDDLSTRNEDQKTKVEDIESEVAELSNAPAEVKRLTAELVELGDPKQVYQLALNTASEREDVEKNLTNKKQQVESENQRAKELEEEMRVYEDLDEKLETEREALKEHESAHQRYLEHVREAEALEDRKDQLASLEEQVEAARDEWKEQAKRRDQAAEGYDGKEYIALTKKYERLRDTLATVKERLRHQKELLVENQEAIKRLEYVQEQLVKTVEEHESLEATLTLLNHLRQLLRDAGPEITRRLVDIISAQADRYYADIMQDYSARLRWTEEYEIILSKDGRERSFPQLSGGEEMAAALAVRLAMLQELTGIDVAFFDEPTANLDDLRRDNLAEQILNVKGFSQLFVISHDDTFEQDTDHVLRVIKEDGVSRVED